MFSRARISRVSRGWGWGVLFILMANPSQKRMSPRSQKVPIHNIIPGKPQVWTIYLCRFEIPHKELSQHNAVWMSHTACLLRSSQSTCGLMCHRTPVKVGAAPPFSQANKGAAESSAQSQISRGRKTPCSQRIGFPEVETPPSARAPVTLL